MVHSGYESRSICVQGSSSYQLCFVACGPLVLLIGSDPTCSLTPVQGIGTLFLCLCVLGNALLIHVCVQGPHPETVLV